MENVSQYSIKFRPTSLKDVFGQDNIVKSLQSRLKERKFPTATLMQGPVGTGKTTCAKILAMSIQCQHPHEDGSPCLECPSCKSILDESYGRDTVLLDASQFGQKDSAIELTSLINIRPMMDPSRVFIIDEVDQGSQSFKLALLKIIERNYTNRSPVYFILLSMENNGVPQSIKSRCQVYNFKSISIKDTMLALRDVMIKDNLWEDTSIPSVFKTEGLSAIATASKGSLRSAMQGLEACIEGKIYSKEEIESFLNVIDEISTFKILDGLLNKTKDDNTWGSIYKVDPQELYNYMTLLLSDSMIYKRTGYINDDRFENSIKKIAGNPNLDYLFTTLTTHPQLCKPYMRKADLLAALASYYKPENNRLTEVNPIPVRNSIPMRGVKK